LANQQTIHLLCKLSDRQDRGWLDLEDFERISCIELQAIDNLWTKYSCGKFGFSVQNQIWNELDFIQFEENCLVKFFDALGWKDETKDLTYDQIYCLQYTYAPRGMLPYGRGRWFCQDIFSKLSSCIL